MCGCGRARTGYSAFSHRARQHWQRLAGVPIHELHRRLPFYASTEVHDCVPKTLRLLGFDPDCLRHVPVDRDYRICLSDLRNRMKVDRKAGMLPGVVAGSAGTVRTGAIDSLQDLAEIAATCGAWFHIDGAFGALAWLVPETRQKLVNLERRLDRFRSS